MSPAEEYGSGEKSGGERSLMVEIAAGQLKRCLPPLLVLSYFYVYNVFIFKETNLFILMKLCLIKQSYLNIKVSFKYFVLGTI